MVSDNFQFHENNLYSALKNDIQGHIILGYYKNRKQLREIELAQYVVKWLMDRNKKDF